MTRVEPSKEEIIGMIVYISQKIDDISTTDKSEILRMIIHSGVSDHKIHSKGNGTQIKYKDMSYGLIASIHSFIHSKIDTKIKTLKSFTEENTTADN